MVELDIELSGSDSYAARFGESITNLGDIDNDGFEGKYENLKKQNKKNLVVIFTEHWTVTINGSIMKD